MCRQRLSVAGAARRRDGATAMLSNLGDIDGSGHINLSPGNIALTEYFQRTFRRALAAASRNRRKCPAAVINVR